jgi:hypothetical protein
MVVVRWVNRMWRLRLRFVVLEDLLVYLFARCIL